MASVSTNGVLSPQNWVLCVHEGTDTKYFALTKASHRLSRYSFKHLVQTAKFSVQQECRACRAGAAMGWEKNQSTPCEKCRVFPGGCSDTHTYPVSHKLNKREYLQAFISLLLTKCYGMLNATHFCSQITQF